MCSRNLLTLWRTVSARAFSGHPDSARLFSGLLRYRCAFGYSARHIIQALSSTCRWAILLRTRIHAHEPRPVTVRPKSRLCMLANASPANNNGYPRTAKDEGLPHDAYLDHQQIGSHDQATRQALYLDASKDRPVVSLSAAVPDFIQEDVAVSHVGRRTQDAAIARVGGRGNFGGEPMLLLNVRASALPAGCRIRLR